LKAVYGKRQEVTALLPVQRRLTALVHDEPGELRDLGLLYAQIRRLGEAIDPLEAYLACAPPADDAHDIRALVEALRHKIAEWN
jgi:regulator of sirC expression with transglutaminase-like and TPR domain